MRTLTLILTLTFVATTLSAQSPVRLRGKVTDGSAAGCYYCPGFQHVLKFSGTRLESSVVDLATFMDQQVEVAGSWNGSFVDVQSIRPVIESFSIGGGGGLGRSQDFTTHGLPGELAFQVMSLGTGMSIPIHDMGVLVDPASAVVLGFGRLDGHGEATSSLFIPNDPTLQGVRFFGQGLVVDANGRFYSTNLDAKEVR